VATPFCEKRQEEIQAMKHLARQRRPLPKPRTGRRGGTVQSNHLFGDKSGQQQILAING
jgi:hypothetical protein